MKILVTGGAGFIGANFICYWLEHHPNDEVINLDKLTYAGNLENLRKIEDLPNYRFVKGDILDGELVNELMQKIQIIVHFAAESHVDRSIMRPSEFVRTNVLGTQVLLEAALKQGVRRFHHVSTDEVFGALQLGSPVKFNEETPYQPRSPYAASKAGADHLVRSYYETYALPVTITNCSNNYGPSQFPEKLIPLVITNLLEDEPVPIYGDGKYVRDWLYVEDHCRAIEAVLQKGRLGETYCIGGQEEKEFTNLELVEIILSLMGKEKDSIEFVKDRPGHDRRYAIDWGKIRDELGWQPRVDLKTGLNKTIHWYQANQEWWQRVKSGQYKEYYRQQYEDRV